MPGVDNDTIMVPSSYLLLMAFHVVGVSFNIRMLASCFKDKAKYTVLQKCRPFMIFQCILHVTVLALNANEVTKAFTGNEQVQEWCGPNGVLKTSVVYLTVYNALAMIAIEHHSIVGLKREVSPKAAMLATLMAEIISGGILFWASVTYMDKFHVCQIASTVVCSLILILVLWVCWIFCTHVDTTESSSLLKAVCNNKGIVFSCVFLTAFALVILGLGAIISVVPMSFPQTEEIKFFKKIFNLYVMCFLAGVVLPVAFKQLIDSSKLIPPV